MATYGFLFTACATTLNLQRTAVATKQPLDPLAPAMAAALTAVAHIYAFAEVSGAVRVDFLFATKLLACLSSSYPLRDWLLRMLCSFF